MTDPSLPSAIPAGAIPAGSGSAQTGRTSAERFDALVALFEGTAGVTTPGEPGRRGFGADALKIDGSIFAMRKGDDLVVKLPAARVSELVCAGRGRAFDAGKGTPMKHWLTVTDADDTLWHSLAGEAAAFVRRPPAVR